MEELTLCMQAIDAQIKKDQAALGYYSNSRVDLIERLMCLGKKLNRRTLKPEELQIRDLICKTTERYKNALNGFVDATIGHSIGLEMLESDIQNELRKIERHSRVPRAVRFADPVQENEEDGSMSPCDEDQPRYIRALNARDPSKMSSHVSYPKTRKHTSWADIVKQKQ